MKNFGEMTKALPFFYYMVKFFGDMNGNGGVEDRWETLRPTLPGQFRDSAGSGKPEAALRTWTKTPEEDSHPEEKQPPRNKDEIFRGYETKVHTREQTQQAITPFPRKISHTIPASIQIHHYQMVKNFGEIGKPLSQTGQAFRIPSPPAHSSFPFQGKNTRIPPQKNQKIQIKKTEFLYRKL